MTDIVLSQDTEVQTVEIDPQSVLLEESATPSSIETVVEEIVLVEEPEIEVLLVTEQGPPGAQGSPGADGYLMEGLVAGESILGHRAVRLGAAQKVFYASASDSAQVNSVLGISTSSAILNGTLFVQTYGDIEEPSWAWTPNQPIYLAESGQLTQVAPTTGFVRILGLAVTATRMFVSMQSPIKLS